MILFEEHLYSLNCYLTMSYFYVLFIESNGYFNCLHSLVETSVVSTRAPNTWKRFKEQINNDMKRAGLTETISDLIVAENDPSCK